MRQRSRGSRGRWFRFDSRKLPIRPACRGEVAFFALQCAICRAPRRHSIEVRVPEVVHFAPFRIARSSAHRRSDAARLVRSHRRSARYAGHTHRVELEIFAAVGYGGVRGAVSTTA